MAPSNTILKKTCANLWQLVLVFSQRPLDLILGDNPQSLGLVLLHTGTAAELVSLISISKKMAVGLKAQDASITY